MTRRTMAALTAAGLLVVTWAVMMAVPLPFVIFYPGPTYNLLSRVHGREMVRVTGHRSYPDKGALRMLTIEPTGPDTHVNLIWALTGWINSDDAVYLHDDIYQPTDNSDSVQEQSSAEMVSSQDQAFAAALRLLGRKVTTSTQVLSILPGGASDGALRARDVFRTIDGTKVSSPGQVVQLIRPLRPGTKVSLGLIRDGRDITVHMKTVESQQYPGRSALEITVGEGYQFPFQVNVGLGDNVGGPSAGMMMALSIYDVLTPGSLTNGGDVAGTGTIDETGRVGAIGGIEQKIVGARNSGAQLFLAPADDCDEVRGGRVDPGAMRIVKVSTLTQALHDLESWRVDHHSPLPHC